MLKSRSWRHLHIRTYICAFLSLMSTYHSREAFKRFPPLPPLPPPTMLQQISCLTGLHAHEYECALLLVNSWRFPFNFSQGCYGRGQWWSQFLAHASRCLAGNPHPEAGPRSLCQSMNVAECGSLQDSSSRVWINEMYFLLLPMPRWSPLRAWCRQDGWHPRINSRYRPPQEMTLDLQITALSPIRVSKVSFAATQARESQTQCLLLEQTASV